MLIITKKLKLRRTAVLLAALTVAGSLLLHGCRNKEDTGCISGRTDAERAEYLRSLGWEIVPEPVEVLSMTLPEPLSEPYISYNVLQREQGFDLSSCAGQTVTRYTYTVTNHPCGEKCSANLYIADDAVVAGDIVCIGENGFIAPLAFPSRD